MTTDVITRVTPLGVGFWDSVTGRLIRNHIDVSVWSKGRPEVRRPAVCNASGIFCAQDLAGLREQERGGGDAAYWGSLHTRRFVIDMRDGQGDFLPLRVLAHLPAKGPLAIDCGSPPGDLPGVPYLPLFSAPSRRLAGPVARLYAQLAVPTTGGDTSPAAWSVAEAWIDGECIALGMADAHGALLLAFPYPAPPHAISSSTEPWSLYLHTWQVELRVRYRAPASDADLQMPPELSAAMLQPRVQAVDCLSPLTPIGTRTLSYGQALVIRSSSSNRGELLLAT